MARSSRRSPTTGSRPPGWTNRAASRCAGGRSRWRRDRSAPRPPPRCAGRARCCARRARGRPARNPSWAACSAPGIQRECRARPDPRLKLAGHTECRGQPWPGRGADRRRPRRRRAAGGRHTGPGARRRRRAQPRRTARQRAALRGLGRPHRGHRRRRGADRARLPAGRGGARHHAARPRRHRRHAQAPRRTAARVRAVPDRPGRGGGPCRGDHRRRRRLRDQAVQPGGGAGPVARPAAPGQADPRADRGPARRRRPDHGRGRPRGPQGRRADRPDRDRVRAAQVPDAQPAAGAVQGADPGPGVELRLRRAGARGRAVHQLPAQEDRRRPGPADPHGPRRRLRAQASGLMSGGRPGLKRPRTRWLAGRTLSARLIAGVVTYLAVQGSMVSALDTQLRGSSGTYAGCIEGNGQGTYAGQTGGWGRPGAHLTDEPPPPNSSRCAQGQPQGMLGARIKDGVITNCGVVDGMTNQTCRLSAADEKALMALPVYHPAAGQQPPWPSSAASVSLTSLDAEYRVTATAGHDGDVLITGLPMTTVEHTLGRVAVAELIVFGCVLLLAGVLGTALVRLSLRPLRRVAATAARVAELPLDSGEVSLPAGVPDSDPRTEVGQVGSAFNRMLGHVERALGRRAASEARLRRFAADASHELRTPLSAIRGYAEFALRHRDPLPGDVAHALRRVQSESARMSVLVDDLLLLARLDAGRPLEREPVDLSRLAIDATSDARAARGDHRWRLDLPGDPVLVRGDEHRLHQVVANILSNAGKHTPAGTTVTVALAVADGPAAGS